MNSMRALHRRGHAALELALLSPWIFFLFVGALDMGFYSYALIATQNAARVAAEYTSKAPGTSADAAGACLYALSELNGMGNLNHVTSCTAAPLVVTARSVTVSDGSAASEVTVAYRTNALIPIPGLLPGQIWARRTVRMRIL